MLIATVPPVFVVKLVKAVDPPITPESVVTPVVLRFNVKAPLTVPPKVMSPAVFPEIIEFAVKLITCAPVVPKEIAVPVD